jgi:hypothetical protein
MIKLEFEARDLSKMVFKPHPKFPCTLVSNFGDVLSTKSGIFRAQHINPKNGYAYVTLETDTGEMVRYTVHRLVVESFLGISELHTNHKDKNRTNNCLDNLEYVTPKENNIHKRMGTRRYVYHDSTNKTRWYIKIAITGKGIIWGGKYYSDKEEAYFDARELYKKHFGVFPW